MVFGWALGESANTDRALIAWQRAKETLQRLGICWTGMIVHHDRDSVFIGYAWTGQLLRKDGVRLSYALRGAKDNPEMESFNSRFKTEGHSLCLDASTLTGLNAIVDERMWYHNTKRRHSILDYVLPMVYIGEVLDGVET